jgi:hypothetical protein
MVKVGRQAGRQAERQILLLVETRLGSLGFGGVMDWNWTGGSLSSPGVVAVVR